MAMSADSIYSETLQSIIDAKFEELVRKKDAYETSKAVVRQAFSSQPNEAEKVRILKDGIKTCFKLQSTSDGGIKGSAVNSDLIQLLRNLDRFLEQPQYDPSLSSYQLQIWASTLEHYFDVQSNRYDFASLYAKLVTEWLVSEKRIGSLQRSTDADMSESFEELESSAKIQSRLGWERIVFEARETDVPSIQDFLKGLFGDANTKKDTKKDTLKALHDVRKQIADFERQMSIPGRFDKDSLKWTIRGLISSDLLSEEKRAVLKDFLNNPIILSEIADVLNLRMDNLENWSWGSTVPVVQQRKVAGHYGIYMQEDLLQAIFIQYIGVRWSVFFKQTLKKFVRTQDAWCTTRKHIPKTDLRRRDYYIGFTEAKYSLDSKRNSLWLNGYFLTQLPESVHMNNSADDGAEEADVGLRRAARTRQTARRGPILGDQMPAAQTPAPAASNIGSGFGGSGFGGSGFGGSSLFGAAVSQQAFPSSVRKAPKASSGINDGFIEDDDEDDVPQDMIGLKQGLLHLLRTEILVNTRLYGDTTGFRAQFQNWNSLLPHSTITAVAEFLGISETWLGFFQAFLRAPLGFVNGSTIEPARIRQRGVPGDHALSDVLGELILFCLDFYINQATNGQKLWRVHDDLWFWSVDQTKCVKAWESITHFAKVMGVSLDMDKAGSVRVTKKKDTDQSIDPRLPQNPIRWGFLYLGSSSGQWEIDDTLVDDHTSELQKQLNAKSDSVLSWIQAWNAYANTFFTTNFGKPAKCFGQAHTQKVLAALEKVQKKLFEDDSSSDVVNYLRNILQKRFGTTNIPEGYFFFPTELGGLDLRNPFISLLLTHEAGERGGDPEVLLDQFEEAERQEYQKRKRTFDKGDVNRNEADDRFWTPSGDERDTFMPFEEFVKYREELSYRFSNELRDVYGTLLEVSSQHSVTTTSDITSAIDLMDKGGVIGQSSSINGDWSKMTPYWRWVTQLYGGEVVKRFGGLNIVDNGVLPIGMVSLFRSERVRWQA